MSDRITELRIENKRLKKQVADLENKVLSLVGMISVEPSGRESKSNINDRLIEMIPATTDQLHVVSPKIDRFYATELKKLADNGIPIIIVTNDRLKLPKEYQKYYDILKSSDQIKIINKPNVNYLLLFNTEQAIFSGGTLDKEELDKSILIVTIIKEHSKIKKIAEIFTLMLPSFMR